jgi:hypothetical protein
MTEHFETRSKKGRGMAQRSLDLNEAMHAERWRAELVAYERAEHQSRRTQP